ncbi:MAG TPA: hypothetical protein VLT36_11895, partial [Candidatus Dormibacteraeota bacterium]|nr:hypothetical protein [Candidatus Dormibacteraeota bacterium]
LKVAKVPATYVWNGPGAGANNWSAAANWSPAGGPPTEIDSVSFFNPGAVSGVSNVNNFVDGVFGGGLNSLQFGNTNNNHTTLIASGQTLTVGNLTVGTETDNGSAQTVFATVTGAGGTLAVETASDLVVRQGSGSSSSQRATLEMSGLGTLSAGVGRILVGVAGPVIRATGTLYLAKTNRITTTGAYPQICVGDNHSNGGGQNYFYLGQDNTILADSITIGREKAVGTMAFSSRFTNATALFRAADGESPMDLWSVGDASAQSTSSSSSTGTNDLSLGTVDALVDTMNVGVGQTSTGANGSGVLAFSSGVIEVNKLQIGVQSATDATSAGIGRVNVNGSNAVLVVDSSLALGATSGGAGTTNSFGTLNINGGTVLANSFVAGAASGPNSLGINGGALVVTNTIGTAASSIATVALTNSTLGFFVKAGQVNLRATNLVTSGTNNVISILSLPSLGTLPTQFQLLKYGNSIAGAGYNFRLGFLAGPLLYGGFLSNNIGGLSVDLVITNAVPRPSPRFTSYSVAGTNLVLGGSNGATNWPYVVLSATNIGQPLNQWRTIATNSFDSARKFSFTTPIDSKVPRAFYRLEVQ